jgi:hypothetical protein
MKTDSSLSALMCWALFADAPFCGIGANIREIKATAHHARSSLRHGHQLDDMAVVVLVIEAATAIPILRLLFEIKHKFLPIGAMINDCSKVYR